MEDRQRLVRAIIAATMKELGVTFDELRGDLRAKPTVLAREAIAYLARQHTMVSYPDISRLMGKSSHPAVIQMERRVMDRIDEESMAGETMMTMCRIMALARHIERSQQYIPDLADDWRRLEQERRRVEGESLSAAFYRRRNDVRVRQHASLCDE